jgi:hypothetical protein
MTTLIEAAKLALEALEEWEKSMSKGALEAHRILRTAIEAAKRQEPVAWAVFEGWNAHDLYLPQEYDEVLKMAGYKGDHAEVKPLYTHPSAAQRQPLTEDRIGQIIEQCKITLVNYCRGEKQTEFARAIEAAHGIKETNT